MLIVKDQSNATPVAASILFLTIGLALAGAGSARAAAVPSATAAVSAAAPSGDEAATVSVTFLHDGTSTTVSTHARTVGDLLDEWEIRPAADDLVDPAVDTLLADGEIVTYRAAFAVDVVSRSGHRTVRTTAATVADFLHTSGMAYRAGDDVSPSLDSPLHAGDVVHVARVESWTSHVRQQIAPKTSWHSDPHLALGTLRVVEPGIPGLRETTLRHVRRDGAADERTVLASRIVREPRAKVIVRGVAAYQSLAHVAEQGFASAVRFAGSAMHMIATAYTAGCYRCSGVTASGVRAGFGVIAVDPHVIPLGSKLFIPGYGRAVAGDTGGAIIGHRIDLGFNSLGQALQWGSRAVTVYLLR